MPNLVNRLVVQELTRELKEVEGMVIVSYGGLNAVENETLRDKLAEKGASIMLVRNSLARRVLAERGLEVGEGVLTGNIAIAYGDAEATVNAAKLLTSPEIKKIKKVTVKGGVLEGRMLSASDAEALADVPDRNTLYSRLLGCLSGPQRGLVSVLNAHPAGVARLLKARGEQLGQGDGEPVAS